MTSHPAWLPEALRYGDYGGDWDKFLAAVYEVFERDFKQSRPNYQGCPVGYDCRMENGKETAFWHMTSSVDRNTVDRLPDLRRCERIPWPRPMIEHQNDKALAVWQNKRKRDTRVLLWLEQLDYLIVLAEKPRTIVLITAYCTDREHTRAKLRKERDNYLEKQKPPRGAT